MGIAELSRFWHFYITYARDHIIATGIEGAANGSRERARNIALNCG
jgi:hypothetical protein